MDHYVKLGGLSKFWDGYDNQPICVIDDPVLTDPKRDKDDIQALKNVMSNGPTQVEIKYGSMQFTSELIIITSNPGPGAIAQACGGENEEAIYRRLTDTLGSHNIDTQAKVRKIPKQILIAIKHIFHMDFDIDDVLSKMLFHKSTKLVLNFD